MRKAAAKALILAALILLLTFLVARAAGWQFIPFPPAGLSIQREGYACVITLDPPAVSCGERE
jgi:hypothetical protein